MALFKDRAEAGRKLAEKISDYRKENCIVFAIPRGGVAIGFEMAKALEKDLDIVVVRKLSAPSDPEFAFGAISMDGSTIIDETSLRRLNLDEDALKNIKETGLKELKRRLNAYREDLIYPQLTGKTAILTDDGIATGTTMLAAIRFLKSLHPKKIVVAVPVLPSQILDKIKSEVDKLIYIEAPKDLYAIGVYYDDFPQLSDDETVKLLKEAKKFTSA